MVAKRLIYPNRDGENSVSSKKCDIPLRPYKHQVGGHAAIFELLDKEHICKPMNEGEAEFYQNMPTELRLWTPEFCYEVELKMNEFKNSYDLYVTNQNPCSSHEHRGQQLAIQQDESGFFDVSSDSDINPWAVECQLRTMKSDRPLKRFMVFENLARHYSMPNILDIKLGIRQYSDNASEEKRKIQTLKCERSTSKKLGLRLCGLQYFEEDTGSFHYVDKYCGRNLGERELFSMFAHFFKSLDGKTRTKDCSKLIEQIEKIKETVKSMPGLRLFGVSLLIILEGQSNVSNPGAIPIARLIDFAHASIDPNDKEVDSGCLLGLENLILTMKKIQNE